MRGVSAVMRSLGVRIREVLTATKNRPKAAYLQLALADGGALSRIRLN